MTVLAALVLGGIRQQFHHFLHDAPLDAETLNARRLRLWHERPTLRPHSRGVLIVDETGDRKRGHGIPYKPVTYELGWADVQTRSPEVILRHWQGVMLAFTFSLLTEAPPPGWVRSKEEPETVDGKIRPPDRVAGDAAEGADAGLS